MKLKNIVAGVIALAVVAPAFAQSTHVRGYTRRDGTYVQPHQRSAPNSTTLDNWSTRGNVNPYNGKVGTRDPYSSANSSTRSSGSSTSSYPNPYDPDGDR